MISKSLSGYLTDESSVGKSQSQFGCVRCTRDDMRRKAVQALAVKSSLGRIILTKHLNVWVEGGSSSWLDIVAWDATARTHDLDIADYEGLPCWIAADLASKLDVACVAYVFERIDGDLGTLYLSGTT